MAELVVQLEDDVIEKLQNRASRNGRSLEEEARQILRDAVKSEDGAPLGLGTRIAARFRDIGLEQDIQELRGYPVVPFEFDS
ncbi:MAG: antitoxin FitA [Thermoanaerobaculia bacterium]|jgi:plasmid stability protein|nr:antitoxin FitA [Thermoanaerobaculia bacterium]